MSKSEKIGLFFMLLGLQVFREGGVQGAIGVGTLVFGWILFYAGPTPVEKEQDE
jgi:hypothetical protein